MSKGGPRLYPMHAWIWGFGEPAEGCAQPCSSLWMLRNDPAHIQEELAFAVVRMTCTACLQDCVAQGSLKQKCLQSLEVSMLPPASLPWALPACCSQHPAVPHHPMELSPLPTFPRHPPQLSDVSRLMLALAS